MKIYYFQKETPEYICWFVVIIVGLLLVNVSFLFQISSGDVMNATKYYVSTCRLVIQTHSENTWQVSTQYSF